MRLVVKRLGASGSYGFEPIIHSIIFHSILFYSNSNAYSYLAVNGNVIDKKKLHITKFSKFLQNKKSPLRDQHEVILSYS
jgi:hypothetical protein